MIKIQFPAHRLDIAKAFGKVLNELTNPINMEEEDVDFGEEIFRPTGAGKTVVINESLDPISPIRQAALEIDERETLESHPITVDPMIEASEFDSKGMPWDERIHSSKKTRVKSDDSWKYLRGVSKELIAHVEVDNKAKVMKQEEQGFEINANGEVEPVVIVDDKVIPPVAPDFKTITVAPVEPVSPVVEFDTIMSTLMERQLNDPKYMDVVSGLLKDLGMKSLPELRLDPVAISKFHVELEKLWVA